MKITCVLHENLLVLRCQFVLASRSRAKRDRHAILLWSRHWILLVSKRLARCGFDIGPTFSVVGRPGYSPRRPIQQMWRRDAEMSDHAVPDIARFRSGCSVRSQQGEESVPVWTKKTSIDAATNEESTTNVVSQSSRVFLFLQCCCFPTGACISQLKNSLLVLLHKASFLCAVTFLFLRELHGRKN